MKIKEIIEKESGEIYTVVFEPSFWEKLIGIKEYSKEYKDTGCAYKIDNGTVYIGRNGIKLGSESEIGLAIDAWRRSW